MPFDGRNYGAPLLVSPIRYHSEAPATGFVLSEVLTSAYVGARLNERICAQTIYPHDFRLPRTVQAASFTQPDALNPLRVSEAWRRLPPDITHVSAEVHFSAFISRSVEVTHRLVIATAAPPPTSSATAITPIEVSSYNRFGASGAALNQRLASFISVMGEDLGFNYRAVIDVELDPALLGLDCEIYVEAELSDASFCSYVPRAAVITWSSQG